MSLLEKYCIDGSKRIKLHEFATAPVMSKEHKEKIKNKMQENLTKISALQDKLYAEGKEGVIIILQAMDAAGKDGTIKHVMRGLNPQGVEVTSFKAPCAEELAHDYLWRASAHFPQRGKMAIFNRSYYEDVLVVKVKKLYKKYKMSQRCLGENIIEKRYKQICNIEEYLYDNSYRVVKIFLHLSKEEQKQRFFKRIDNKIKNWKLSPSDVQERTLWNEYQLAYEQTINATAAEHAPWYVLPADEKWYTHYLVSEVLLELMEKINPQYPEISKEQSGLLKKDREILLNEDKEKITEEEENK